MTDQTANASLRPDAAPPPIRATTLRHSAWVRLTHWIWVVALVVTAALRAHRLGGVAPVGVALGATAAAAVGVLPGLRLRRG